MTPLNSNLITLANGMTVPAAVIVLGNQLERKGITFVKDGDILRVSGPDGPPDLTPDEVAGIRKYKAHLLALTEYQAPEPTQCITPRVTQP